MKKTIFWRGVAVIAAFIVFSPLGQAQILIGQTVGMTGPVAATVKEAVEGAQLYIDSVNA